MNAPQPEDFRDFRAECAARPGVDPRLSYADFANWDYQEYLEVRRRVKMWKYTANMDWEVTQLKSLRASMQEALRLGGFPNISQALQYRRNAKAQNKKN